LKALSIIMVLTVLMLLSPWLLNRAPYIGDSWVHLKKAEEIIKLGRFNSDEYNEMWPLINLIIAFSSIIGGANSLVSSQLIPLLVSLSVMNIYILANKISESPISGVAAGTALAFIPLYTFLTFGSAIMKETASFYLSTLIIAYLLSSKFSHICFALLSLGLIFGHHFGSLAVFLLMLTLFVEDFLELLAGESKQWFRTLADIILFGSFLFVWNLYVVSRIGWFSPVDLESLSMFSLIWTGSYAISRVGKIPSIMFQTLLIPLVFLAWRGHLHTIPTPVNPISIWEIINLLIFFIPTIIGLAMYWRKTLIRSLLASTSTMIVFSLVWSLDYEGLVVFTKSLHYYGVFLAIVFSLSACFIAKKRFGKVIVAMLLAFLVYASITGVSMALQGPGAYHEAEYIEMSSLSKISSEHIVMDTKLAYLAEYLNMSYSSIHRLKSGEYILLTKSDFTHGILLGYVWADISLYIPAGQITFCDKVFDGGYLKLLRVNNV